MNSGHLIKAIAVLLIAVSAASAQSGPFSMQNLGTLGTNSEGHYVNENGDVAGNNQYGGNPTVFRAFLYKNAQMIDLGTVNGGQSSFVSGINANGDVIGTGNNAFLYKYSTGQMIALGTLGGSYSSTTGINDNGDVVGGAYIAGDSAQHAFLYRNGQMIDLGTLGGRHSVARAINNNGDIIGESQVSTTNFNISHAFLYRNGQMIDLGTLGGSTSYPVAINASGDVVGYSNLAGDINYHAFLYKNGQMIDLGTLPGGANSDATGINDNGDVIGNSELAGNSYVHAFLYRNGQMIDLGTLGATQRSVARAINNNGDVVGRSDLFGPERAFLYRDGQMIDLGTLGGTSSIANDVSNSGYITGRSHIANDSGFRAYRIYAPPIPPAPSLKLKVDGGNLLIGSPGQGLILRSPGGLVCRSIGIDNAGAMTVQTVTCP